MCDHFNIHLELALRTRIAFRIFFFVKFLRILIRIQPKHIDPCRCVNGYATHRVAITSIGKLTVNHQRNRYLRSPGPLLDMPRPYYRQDDGACTQAGDLARLRHLSAAARGWPHAHLPCHPQSHQVCWLASRA